MSLAKTRTFDALRSTQDDRDYTLASAPPLLNSAQPAPAQYVIPESRSLPIWDQQDGGACVAFSSAAAFAILLKQNGGSNYDPSRLFIYSQAKYMDNRPYSDDGGLYLRDACALLRLNGTCRDSTWPYNAAKFAVRPPAGVVDEAEAVSGRISYYLANPTLPVLKYILQGLNTPVLITFEVYNTFVPDASTSLIPIPIVGTDTALGGHSMLLVGYDDSKNAFLARNSYGAQWGVAGHCWMPYTYILDPELTFEHRFFKPTDRASDPLSAHSAAAGGGGSGGGNEGGKEWPGMIIVVLASLLVVALLTFLFWKLVLPFLDSLAQPPSPPPPYTQ